MTTLPTISEMEAMLDGLAELADLYPEDAEPIALWFEWVEGQVDEAKRIARTNDRMSKRWEGLKSE